MTDVLRDMHDEEQRHLVRLRANRAYRLDEEAYALAENAVARVRKESGSLLDVLVPPDTVGREPKDVASFLTSLDKHLHGLGVAFSASSLLTEEERGEYGEHVAYPQNRHTEEAYRLLTRRMKRPGVTYCTDFAASCAEVRDGLADLCILPLRDGEGAYLRSFLHLLEEYGLSVRAYAFCEDEEGGGTHYALCGRGVCIPVREKMLCMEILLPARRENDAAALTALVSAIGGGLIVGEILPDPHTAGTLARLAYRIDEKNAETLLLALRLFASDALVYGVSAYRE